MKITYVGKNIEVTPCMKESVEKKLQRVGNYFKCEKEAKCVMSIQKNGGVMRHRVEMTLYLNDLTFRAEETTDDMYASIDSVVDSLERNIRKAKTKLRKNFHKSFDYSDIHIDNEPCDLTEDESCIVKRKHVSAKPMSEDEAILQMEALNHDFYVFVDENNVTSVVYKRKEGNYGIIHSN